MVIHTGCDIPSFRVTSKPSHEEGPHKRLSLGIFGEARNSGAVALKSAWNAPFLTKKNPKKLRRLSQYSGSCIRGSVPLCLPSNAMSPQPTAVLSAGFTTDCCCTSNAVEDSQTGPRKGGAPKSDRERTAGSYSCLWAKYLSTRTVGCN